LSPFEPFRRGCCVFLNDVVCSSQKRGAPKILDRCLECVEYRRFVFDMEREEEDFFKECDLIRKFGYPRVYDKRGRLVR